MPARRVRDVAIYLVFIAVIMALPLFVEDYALNQVARFLVYGILGVAIALSWGYAGILNLGQGLFFGLGAYMMAMSLKLASNTSLQQGSDKPVPDFMLWNAEPGALPRAQRIIRRISLVSLSHELLDNAATVPPGGLPTTAAVHLASALAIKRDLTAFVCYDERLCAAAEVAGLPVASPA